MGTGPATPDGMGALLGRGIRDVISDSYPDAIRRISGAVGSVTSLPAAVVGGEAPSTWTAQESGAMTYPLSGSGLHLVRCQFEVTTAWPADVSVAVILGPEPFEAEDLRGIAPQMAAGDSITKIPLVTVVFGIAEAELVWALPAGVTGDARATISATALT